MVSAAILAFVGFMGADRALYEWTLATTNTPSPADRDFYQLTKPFWHACRLMGLWWGAALAYLAVLAFHRDGWRRANRLALAVLLAVGLCYMLKAAFGRTRPNQADTHLSFQPVAVWADAEATASFPSGEAMLAFALAAALSRLAPACAPLFLVLAALTALARLVQGAHYLSDVSAAAFLAFALIATLERHVWPAPWLAGQPAAVRLFGQWLPRDTGRRPRNTASLLRD